MVLYYDNDISGRLVNGTAMPVERVYCLRLNDFEPEDWEILQRAYENLPGWAGVGEHGCSCWFGTSESAPFLVASVEPSGPIVTGILDEQVWNEWHKTFEPVLSQLPNFEA